MARGCVINNGWACHTMSNTHCHMIICLSSFMNTCSPRLHFRLLQCSHFVFWTPADITHNWSLSLPMCDTESDPHLGWQSLAWEASRFGSLDPGCCPLMLLELKERYLAVRMWKLWFLLKYYHKQFKFAQSSEIKTCKKFSFILMFNVSSPQRCWGMVEWTWEWGGQRTGL